MLVGSYFHDKVDQRNGWKFNCSKKKQQWLEQIQ